MKGIKDVNGCHIIWHKFSKYLEKTFGKDLWSEKLSFGYTDKKGETKTIFYKNYNEFELNKRLQGYNVISKIEKYINKYIPEIKIIHCDDSAYAGSILLLIPHPKHGITIMFIPQCSGLQNQFFLYDHHLKMLMKELNNMKWVYKDESKTN